MTTIDFDNRMIDNQIITSCCSSSSTPAGNSWRLGEATRREWLGEQVQRVQERSQHMDRLQLEPLTHLLFQREVYGVY
jgi:hypothetical protein